MRNQPITKSVIFKQCTTCGFEWANREHFLEDPTVTAIGYQVNFEELAAGIFLFNHSCGTTLGIYADDFKSLYDGPIFTKRATATEECPEFCLHQHDLRPCPAQCECAYVREIMQVIRQWPKGLEGHAQGLREDNERMRTAM